jgi:protein SCO1/2/putative membrane protein
MRDSIRHLICWTCALSLLAAANPIWAEDSYGSKTQDTLLQSFVAPVAPFTLTDQDGEAFSSEKLAGKVWVAHFFYIACNKCNSTYNPAMSELQKLVRGRPDLVLVSISLNQDSAEDLKSYSERWGAEPGQWIFLTGPKDVVHDIFKKSFQLGLKEEPLADPGSIIIHDPKLVVVDRQGFRQGYISGDNETVAQRLFRRMHQLAGARYKLSDFNAVMNFASAVLLVAGYLAIRRRFIRVHEICMLSALTASTVFLGSYLYYHFAVLAGQSPRFPGSGAVWYVYIAILLSHTILAAVVAPLAVTVTYLGLRNNLARHVWLARWTLPIWLYVSVTGVVVYLMLYQFYPPY